MIVVITGASSGIGKAVALAFARQGATLVLAARNKEALQQVSGEIRDLGAEALPVPTDISKPEEAKALAERSIQAFEGLDVWINNAAVTAFGPFEAIPDYVFRRVIETNLMGYVYGARAALPHFRHQGKGILINVSSVVGKVGQPYTSPYTTSKFAIRGLTQALRAEYEAFGIDVCSVLPASIDTPIFQHGANYSGKKAKPMKPVDRAEEVAKAIIDPVADPKPEIVIGKEARVLTAAYAVAPGTSGKRLASRVEKSHFQDTVQPPTDGNLFEPFMDGYVSGGWKGS